MVIYRDWAAQVCTCAWGLNGFMRGFTLHVGIAICAICARALNWIFFVLRGFELGLLWL
jgi:hypothetical protein